MKLPQLYKALDLCKLVYMHSIIRHLFLHYYYVHTNMMNLLSMKRWE